MALIVVIVKERCYDIRTDYDRRSVGSVYNDLDRMATERLMDVWRDHGGFTRNTPAMVSPRGPVTFH